MKTPVLIIGSGLAGLMTAYRLAQLGIESLVVSKDEMVLEGSNSVHAQGGIIYKAEQGDPEALKEDIISAGEGINSLEAVEQLVTKGVEWVKAFLVDEVQVPFDREGQYLSLTQEAAHTYSRIIYVKDHSGKAIMEALLKKVQQMPQIRILSGYQLVDLLTSGHNCRGYRFKYKRNRCIGAYLFNRSSGEVETVFADYTVLCTGGIGQVYEYHTNGEHAYGSGLAVANRARIRIINARFVQFHPTALWTPSRGRRFLISEALRGEGARLMNRRGKYLMESYPLKDLESRAVVSRVMMEELQSSGDEYLYLNLADHYQGEMPLKDRFPSIYEKCLEEGIDMAREPIPVIPAEHFSCGGIFVDLDGQTEMAGLFAAGEVACTGVHGANRLASTSLLECLTWGITSAEKMAELVHSQSEEEKAFLEEAFDLVDPWMSFGDKPSDPDEVEREKNRIRRLMWEEVGILRTKEGLLRAREELRALWREIDRRYASYAISSDLIELRHMIETAYLITLSASSHTSLKKDSIGGHVLRKEA